MNSMTSRQRVFAALAHQEPDRIPRFEIWIDALLDELCPPGMAGAETSLRSAHTAAFQGQDCVMLPSRRPPGSNAWETGVDEWGRVWRDGMYVNGVVDTDENLARYSPPLSYAQELFDAQAVNAVGQAFPDHCLIFGTHIGPFMATYLAMGFERFFYTLFDDPGFVQRMMDARTDWAIAQFQRAVSLGAEVIVVGDDAAHREGPMISPRMWRELVLPCHRRLVEALDVPVIWHSDGDVRSLLPMAVEAGFAGFHGLEPPAGIDLAAVKASLGRDLVLIGNVDVGVLCGSNLDAVRREVDRCLNQGGPTGYMLATCNSIFAGMNPAAVLELFRYQARVVG